MAELEPQLVPTTLHIFTQSHRIVRPDSLEPGEFISEIVEVFGFLFRGRHFSKRGYIGTLTFLAVPGVLFWGVIAFWSLGLRVVVGIAWYGFAVLWYCTLG